MQLTCEISNNCQGRELPWKGMKGPISWLAVQKTFGVQARLFLFSSSYKYRIRNSVMPAKDKPTLQ